MIEIKINTEKELKKIERQLSELQKSKSKQILRTAINKTAVEATKLLVKTAQETYAIKVGGIKGKSKSAIKVEKAKSAKLVAKLKSEGTPIELFKFKTSPSSYDPHRGIGSISKGKVKKASKMSILEIDERMAFVVKFKNGKKNDDGTDVKSTHTTLAQRIGKERYPIKVLYSLSVPQMLGNEKEVYGIVEPKIAEMLQRHIREELERVKVR